MTESKTMRELRALLARDQRRFDKLATLWGDLTDEYQDELLALAAKRAAEVEAPREGVGMNGCEIKPGMRIQFIHVDSADPVDGIVNGNPWVWWNGIDAEARIPVHVPSLNASIDVAGHNVFRVAAEPLRSVRA